jgi:hypothetical protein
VVDLTGELEAWLDLGVIEEPEDPGGAGMGKGDPHRRS